MLDQATIDRYQPGGDVYADTQAQWGTDAANALAAAAATGDNSTVLYTLSNIRRGQYTVGSPNSGTSFWGNLGSQLYNNPLGAPLDQAGTVASNTAGSLQTGIKNALGGLLANPLATIATLAVGALVVWVVIKKLE